MNDLLCLLNGRWLNDNIINYYISILEEKNELKDIKIFNTYFINKLIQNGKYNYMNVRRWSRKIDIFKKDKILIPINQNNVHWTLILIDMIDKIIYYIDSLGGLGDKYFDNILHYLRDESIDKRKKEYNTNDWEYYSWYKYIYNKIK